MQYNKQQFNKVNDKKIMKKVKKQWVVVSVASLAVLGGFAVSGTLHMNQPTSSVVAHADQKDGQSAADTQNNQNKKTDNGQPFSTPQKQSGQPSGTSQKQSGQTDSSQPFGTSQDHTHSLKDTADRIGTGQNTGAQNYTNGDSKPDSGDASNQYNDASNGFNAKLNNDQDNEKSNQGNDNYKIGQDLADKYKDVINKGAQDVANNAGDQSGTYGDATQKQYYENSYNGASKAKSDYNAKINGQGTSDKDYTSYNNTVNNNNSSSQNNPQINNGADNPQDASSSSRKYDQNLKDKFNSVDNNGQNQDVSSGSQTYNGNSTNSSVQNNNVNVPTTNDVANAKANSKLNGVQADTYAYGYNYFMANQAAIDYEDGKWKGTYYKDNNNGSDPTSDYYLKGNPDKNSSYYQGYIGAQNAINNQWSTNSQSTTKPYTLNSNDTVINGNNVNANSFQQLGYQSAANEIKNGDIFVQNGAQFDVAMLDDSSESSNIRLINDINMKGVYSNANQSPGTINNTESPLKFINSKKNSLSINGQNHIADMSGAEYWILNNSSSLNTMNVSNFKTIYGEGYFGPFFFDYSTTNRTINYKNINYVGVQLLSAQSTNSTFDGNTNVLTVSNYTSPFQKNVNIANKDQQNLEVNGMTLKRGANYFGDTNFYSNGNGSDLIQVYGSKGVTLGENSNMTLLPGGNSETGIQGSGNFGLSISSSDASFNVNKNATLNVIPYNSSSSVKGNGIYNSGSINIDGGIVNIETNGDNNLGGPSLITNNGNINITDGGLLQVKLMNSNVAYTSGLVNVSSGKQFNVVNGNLVIDGRQNNSQPVTLLYGSINVNDPGKKGILLNTNKGGSLISNGTVTSNTVAVDNDSQRNLYYQYNVNSNGTINAVKGDGTVDNGQSINGQMQLNIYRTPSVSVSGPVNAQYDNQKHTVTITGNLVVDRSNEMGNNDNGIYLKSQADSVNQSGTEYHQQNFADNTTYYDRRDGSQDGVIIPFTETINNVNSNPTNISTYIKYGIQGTNINLSKSAGSNNYDQEKVDAQAYKSNNDGSNTVSVDPTKALNFLNVNNGDIQRAIKDAIDDKESNSQNYKDDDSYENSTLYSDNYDSAINGYTDYQNNPNNQNITDYTQMNGYDKAKGNGSIDALEQGYKAAQKNAGATDYVNGNKDSNSGDNYNTGYNDANAGYKDGAKGNSIATNASNEYTKGYVAGRGTNDYLSGQSSNPDSVDQAKNNSVNQAVYNQSYGNTQQGYQDNQAGNKPAKSNASYDYGYQMSKGMKDANGNVSEQDGIKDLPTNSAGNVDVNGSSYQAYQDGRNAYNGINDFLNGQSKGTNNTDADKNTTNNTAYNRSYDAAQKGLTDNPTKNNYISGTPQWIAYNAGVAAKQGEADAQSGSSNTADSYTGSPFNGSDALSKIAYNTARGNFNAGANRQGASTNPNTDSQAYKDGQAAQAGQQAAANGDKTTPTSTYPKNANGNDYDSNQKSAYDNAKQAYNAGLSDNKGDDSANASKDQAANNAGLSANQGIKDAFSGGNTDNPKDSTSYTASKQATKDGMNGQQPSNADQQQMNAYNTGKAAYDAMQAAKQDSTDPSKDSGADVSAYKNGFPNSGTQAQQDAYKQAYTAYKDGLANGKGTTNNDNPAGDSVNSDETQNIIYKAGQNADATQAGIRAAEASGDAKHITNSDGYNSGNGTDGQKSSYINAYNAYKDGYGNQSNNDAVTNNQGDAYNQGKAAQQAVQDAFNNKANQDSNYQSPTQASQKAAYDQAYTAYQNGVSDTENSSNKEYSKKGNNSNQSAYQAGQTANATKDGIATAASKGQTNNDSKYSSDTDTDPAKIAYNNAKDAYNAGLDNNSTSDEKTSANNSPIANQAGLDARQGMQDAIANPNTTPDGTKSQSYQDAYKAAQNGAKGSDETGSDKAQQAAYNYGKAAQNGANDVQNNSNASSANAQDGKAGITDYEKSAYDNAVNDFKSGAGQTTNPDNYTPNKNSEAYKEGQAAQQGQQSSAKGNNDDKNASDFSSDQKQADAYNKAKDNYNAGLGNTPKDNSRVNQSSAAYQAGVSANKGIIDGSANVTPSAEQQKDPNYMNAYNAAKNGSDSNNNGNPTDSDNANNVAYQAGKDAQQGAKDAASGKVNDKQYSGVNKTAYDNAVNDFRSGAGQATDPSNYKPNTNSAAYQAGQAEQQGMKDYQSGDNNQDGNTKYANKNQQDAYNQAKTDFSNGYQNKSGDGINTNSTAYKAGKAANQGLEDAKDGKSTNSEKYPNEGNYSDNSTKDAYKNAIDAYNAGANGNSTDPDKAAAKADSNANQAGLNAYNGTNDAIAGKGKQNGNNQDYSNAYDSASKNYNYGFNDDTDKTKNPDLNTNSKGYQAGQAARQAIIDDQNGDNKTGAQAYPNSTIQQNAYDKAKSDFDKGRNGDNSGIDTNNNPAYQAGDAAKKGITDAKDGAADESNNYNDNPTAKQAYQNARNAYNNGLADNGNKNGDAQSYQAGSDAKRGMDDYLAGKTNQDIQNTDYTNAYNAAKDGKQAGSTKDPSSANDINNKVAYQTGQAANQGTADAQSGADNSGQYKNNPSAANAYQNAKNAYNDGFNGKDNSVNQDANNVGKAARQGTEDAKNGTDNSKNYPNNPEKTAYQNAKNAYNDGFNGKDNSNNPIADSMGKAAKQGIEDSKNSTDNSKSYSNDPEKTAYNDAKNAYQAGLNGDTTSAIAKKNSTANKAGNANYVPYNGGGFNKPNNNKPNNDKDDQEVGTKAGQKAFAGGTPLNINHVNFAGKSQAYKDAFTKGYNDSQAGFDAGLNGGKNNNSDNPSFKAGYQSAQAYKQGVNDATRGKKPAKNISDAYKVGYEAYKEGISGKKANKATLDKLAPAYRKAYEKNYQAARKAYVAVAGKASKAARKNAVGTKRIPRSLKHESPAYQAAYMEAFNDYVKRNLPRYVYNLKKVYSHDAPALTRSTRVKKYSKTPRYDRHVFRVLGYKITSSGHVVYRVKGLGWISASDKSVDNVYYRRHDTKKPIQKIRVIKPQGTYIYSSKTFNKKTAVKKMKKGSTVKVERIETVGGITRFYIGDGQYISSNKTIVEHVR